MRYGNRSSVFLWAGRPLRRLAAIAVLFAMLGPLGCGSDDSNEAKAYDEHGITFQYPGYLSPEKLEQSDPDANQEFADFLAWKGDQGVVITGTPAQMLKDVVQDGDIPDEVMNEFARAEELPGIKVAELPVHVHVGSYPAIHAEYESKSTNDKDVYIVSYVVADLKNLKVYRLYCQSALDQASRTFMEAACAQVINSFVVK